MRDYFFVPLPVSFYLLAPIFRRQAIPPARELPTMPKVAINKYGNLLAGDGDIGASYCTFVMFLEINFSFPKLLKESGFDLGIPGADF